MNPLNFFSSSRWLGLAFAVLLVPTFGCGRSYVARTVTRPPLIDATPSKTIDLVDVHIASETSTAEELLEMRRAVLPRIARIASADLRKGPRGPSIEGRLSPLVASPVAPIADAWTPCIARDLGAEDRWKIAVAVSSSGPLTVPLLDAPSYFVTVKIALWDEADRLVDWQSFAVTNESMHPSIPVDEEELGTESAASNHVDDPVWLGAVSSALAYMLEPFRTTTVKRFVRIGDAYVEPAERTRYRAAHLERMSSKRCPTTTSTKASTAAAPP